MKISFVQIGLK